MFNRYVAILVCAFSLLSGIIIAKNDLNFAQADYNSMHFPKDFLFGVVQGKSKKIQDPLPLLQPLGVNAYNFALDWSAIEPKEGYFDTTEIEKVVNMCANLKAQGVKPVVYLFHSDVPAWFYEKGAFEQKENIKHFVRYSKKMFEALHEHVDMWLTFYQPAGYALERYLRGMYYPGKKDMQLALEVLHNMLVAHVEMYETIKGRLQKNGTRSAGLLGAEKVQIGLAHHIYWFESYYKINLLDQIAAAVANKLNNKLVFEFFKTGNFSFTMPFIGSKYWFLAHINAFDSRAPHSIDFMGIIYHAHALMKNFSPVGNPDETPTDLELFRIYPQGLMHAISLAAPLKVPIHIMGNGIADAQDKHRSSFIQQHMYVIWQAIKQGFDVRSYFYRVLYDSPEDNYKFGLYTHDSKGNLGMQPSAQTFIDIVNRHN